VREELVKSCRTLLEKYNNTGRKSGLIEAQIRVKTLLGKRLAEYDQSAKAKKKKRQRLSLTGGGR
jgi:hypothetical protein